jgi:hypothetical protein
MKFFALFAVALAVTVQALPRTTGSYARQKGAQALAEEEASLS